MGTQVRGASVPTQLFSGTIINTPLSAVVKADNAVGAETQEIPQSFAPLRTHGDIARALLRIGTMAAVHAVLFVFIFATAFSMRFDFTIPSYQLELFWRNLPWILAVKMGVFYATGLFHGWWRHATMSDLASLLKASAISLISVVMIDHFLVDAHVPRSIPILDFTLTILGLGALKASWRLVREMYWLTIGHTGGRSALLIGADSSAGLLAHQMRSLPQAQYRIRGLLDWDSSKIGTRLGCFRVLGSPDNVGMIARKHGVSDVFVIAGSLSGKRLRTLMDDCARSELSLKIIPPAEELFHGTDRIPTRDIEINDLLRRDPVQLDSDSIATLLRGRTVLVTGAGGSIGSEICRQVLKFEPKVLVLVGKGENRIFFIERELQGLRTTTRLVPKIADITDQRRMRRIFQEYRPEIVFHAAAHKHVPLMEANIGEAIKNNVCGTKCIADLAHEFQVNSFVLISSDKAVNPANVMGATKNLAERYVMALAEESKTRFIATRFGNVLGSAGSVVPLFQEQIRRGGPITITDHRMTRYFMTIPEASQLVLQAAALGRGRQIFVLDMGEPVRIVDLALDMIRLSGLPEDAIEIVCTGIRPGEKLYEELYFDDEETAPTSHKKLRVAYHRGEDLTEIQAVVQELLQLADGQEDLLLRRLHEIVPEYLTRHEKAREAAVPAPKTFDYAETSADRRHITL
ncbi:MAG: nucleoside-diphosphate sugar epimerase/dehydratase [Planctomycetaceae bacterium]